MKGGENVCKKEKDAKTGTYEKGTLILYWGNFLKWKTGHRWMLKLKWNKQEISDAVFPTEKTCKPLEFHAYKCCISFLDI